MLQPYKRLYAVCEKEILWCRRGMEKNGLQKRHLRGQI